MKIRIEIGEEEFEATLAMNAKPTPRTLFFDL